MLKSEGCRVHPALAEHVDAGRDRSRGRESPLHPPPAATVAPSPLPPTAAAAAVAVDVPAPLAPRGRPRIRRGGHEVAHVFDEAEDGRGHLRVPVKGIWV
jgi:hypothetical protein